MRKHQQKRILELTMTLSEAYAEMKRLLARQDFANAVKLLCECQEFVLQIGSYIESIAGEGTRTVALLEDCHEALYLAAAQISGASRECSAAQGLSPRLQAIEESVRNELKPDKPEVLFLPYKAAMWDSLESIWLAAREDPGCDAQVIPIPYYDRLPNGGLGQMHYEGDQYPAYVPITDWQTYDIEASHPDIIFIHSPYDDGNTITSIHPVFYSKRLKEFTDLLVYVPYFVCVDDVQEHFCVCTGTMYAGKVFVQSEKIRQTYIRVFKQFEDQYQCHNMFGRPEDKFVAIGSPKFDKVLRSRPEDFTLPEAWRRLIAKPDGACKKVVLYNTTIDAILRGNDKYLDKIQSVLDTFRSRQDAVLWWRPHPLNETVYRSMQPQLLARYEQIAADYRQAGYGIFDDTPDLHRALCLTDGYYGDWSSLVAMYQCTGRPVMISNPDQCGGVGKTLQNALFWGFYHDGNQLWFVEERINALFRMDEAAMDIEYVGSFPSDRHTYPLYRQITQGEGKLYAAPAYADCIAAFDKQSEVFSKKSYRQLPPEHTDRRNFIGAVSYGDSIFFTPCKYPAIMSVNTLTDEVHYYSDWVEPLQKLTSDTQDLYFLKPLVTGHTMWLAACGANAVVEFDLITRKSNVHEVGGKHYRFNGICYDGSQYWLSPRYDTPVVKWHPSCGVMEEFPIPEQYAAAGRPCFHPVLHAGGYVWLIPIFACQALKIDLRTNEMTIAEPFAPAPEGDGVPLAPGAYYFSQAEGDRIYALDCRLAKLITYCSATGRRSEKPVRYNEKTMARIKPLLASAMIKTPGACKTESDLYYYESGSASVDDFINYLIFFSDTEDAGLVSVRQMELFAQNNRHADGSAGKAIYEYGVRMLKQKEEPV